MLDDYHPPDRDCQYLFLQNGFPMLHFNKAFGVRNQASRSLQSAFAFCSVVKSVLDGFGVEILQYASNQIHRIKA